MAGGNASSPGQLEIVVIMCGPMVGLAGGDTHALRFVDGYERKRPGSVKLMTPPDMASHLPPSAEQTVLPLRTPLDAWVRNLLMYALIVVARTVVATIRVPAAKVAIAESHFFHDVIPCVVARRRYGSRVAVFIYHVVADMNRARSLRSAVSLIAERFSLWLLRHNADVVFVDNAETAQSLERRGFAKTKIVMTANGFDPVVPMPERVNNGRPLLAFCGRFVDVKGIWDILELGQALSKTVPEAHIEMIGDGPMREEFARRLSATDLQNISMLGFVSEADKWALLRRATLFVAPSREEGWGIAVGEALTAGTPVLAYDLPAYRYLGDMIQRVPTGDTDTFVAEACGMLVDRERLEAARLTLTSAGGRLPQWDEILEAEFAALERVAAL